MDNDHDHHEEHHEIRITPAKDAAEAKGYMEKAGLTLNGAHGALLRALLIAKDNEDAQSIKIFNSSSSELRDAMGYLTAVEIFLHNEMQRPKD